MGCSVALAAPVWLREEDGMTSASSSNLRPLLAVLAVLALIALVPLASPSNRFLSLAISAGINIIALYGLSVLFGQTGILSMGHAALVGVGAYTAAILLRDFGIEFWVALPAAGLTAAAFAAVIGIPFTAGQRPPFRHHDLRLRAIADDRAHQRRRLYRCCDRHLDPRTGHAVRRQYDGSRRAST